MLKFVEYLQMNCKCVKGVCCELCDHDYYESYGDLN